MAKSRSRSHKEQTRPHKKRTLASKVGVSQKRLAKKIQTVKREDPSLTNRQAAGKAAGILEWRKKKGR